MKSSYSEMRDQIVKDDIRGVWMLGIESFSNTTKGIVSQLAPMTALYFALTALFATESYINRTHESLQFSCDGDDLWILSACHVEFNVGLRDVSIAAVSGALAVANAAVGVYWRRYRERNGSY